MNFDNLEEKQFSEHEIISSDGIIICKLKLS